MDNEKKPSRRDPRVRNKLCEYMNYSTREAFKRLRTNLLISLPEESGKSRIIGVTSAQVSEGKSTVCVNLAYSLAELGKKVVLIDGDLRRPTIHEKLNLRCSPGMVELLNKETSVGETVVRYTSDSSGVEFDVFTAGQETENPAELLNSSRFKKFLEAASKICDYIIIDLPPVNAVIDAVGVSSMTDGMIVVLRQGHCPRYALDDCLQQLRYAKANILGLVMNGCAEGTGKRNQYGYGYGSYGYGYGYGYTRNGEKQK